MVVAVFQAVYLFIAKTHFVKTECVGNEKVYKNNVISSTLTLVFLPYYHFSTKALQKLTKNNRITFVVKSRWIDQSVSVCSPFNPIYFKIMTEPLTLNSLRQFFSVSL